MARGEARQLHASFHHRLLRDQQVAMPPIGAIDAIEEGLEPGEPFLIRAVAQARHLTGELLAKRAGVYRVWKPAHVLRRQQLKGVELTQSRHDKDLTAQRCVLNDSARSEKARLLEERNGGLGIFTDHQSCVHQGDAGTEARVERPRIDLAEQLQRIGATPLAIGKGRIEELLVDAGKLAQREQRSEDTRLAAAQRIDDRGPYVARVLPSLYID